MAGGRARKKGVIGRNIKHGLLAHCRHKRRHDRTDARTAFEIAALLGDRAGILRGKVGRAGIADPFRAVADGAAMRQRRPPPKDTASGVPDTAEASTTFEVLKFGGTDWATIVARGTTAAGHKAGRGACQAKPPKSTAPVLIGCIGQQNGRLRAASPFHSTGKNRGLRSAGARLGNYVQADLSRRGGRGHIVEMFRNFIIGRLGQVMRDFADNSFPHEIGDCSPEIAEGCQCSHSDRPVKLSALEFE